MFALKVSVWKRQPTGYLKYKSGGPPLSCSLHEPHQSLGRNHIHYSFPYIALGRHNPHLWASACLSLCVCMSICVCRYWYLSTQMYVWVCVCPAMSLRLYVFADVHVCDHMQIFACFVYICASMCVWWRRGVGFIATCYSWRRLLQCAAVWGRFPVEPLWSHCLSGTASASGSQLKRKHLHTKHSGAPLLTSQYCLMSQTAAKSKKIYIWK